METHKANAALAWFTAGERISTDTGRAIVTTKDGEPDWASALRRYAHDDGDGAGDMLPDDFRHEFIRDALEAIAEESEYAPEPSIYNAELCRWLASHGWRAGYCDEAAEEWGSSREGGVMAAIAAGMAWEMQRVYDRVAEYLEALDDEEIAETAEAAS